MELVYSIIRLKSVLATHCTRLLSLIKILRRELGTFKYVVEHVPGKFGHIDLHVFLIIFGFFIQLQGLNKLKTSKIGRKSSNSFKFRDYQLRMDSKRR